MQHNARTISQHRNTSNFAEINPKSEVISMNEKAAQQYPGYEFYFKSNNFGSDPTSAPNFAYNSTKHRKLRNKRVQSAKVKNRNKKDEDLEPKAANAKAGGVMAPITLAKQKEQKASRVLLKDHHMHV